MKKILMVISVFLAIILLAIGLPALKIFVIGKIADVNDFAIHDTSITDEKVSLYFYIPLSSVDVVRSYSYRIKDDILYIKFKTVFVGIFKPVNNIEIAGEFSTLNKIIFEDKENQRVVWER